MKIRRPTSRTLIVNSLLIIFLLLLAAFFCLFVPIFDKSTVYRLAEKNDNESSIREYIQLPQRYPEYIIYNNKVYLAYFYRANSLLLAEGVTPVIWDADKLQEFRHRHPELENKWPDSSKPNGGISWIVNPKVNSTRQP